MNAYSSKKNGSILISAFISTLALVTSLPTHAESLKEIYQQALTGDHEYQAAKAELGSDLEQKNLERSGLLPSINGKASLSKSDLKNKVLDISDQTDGLEYGIELKQSILDMSLWHNYKKGKLQASGAQLKFDIAEQNLILRTAESYLTALKSADEANTAKAEQNALSHQLEQTKQRFEVGLTAITEVHEAQAAFDSSTASRLLADGSLGIAFESLEALTGVSYTSLHPLKKDFSTSTPQPAARADWVKLALGNNTSLKIAKINNKISEASAKAAKSVHLPTLSASLSYGSTDSESDSFTRDEDSGSARLDLNIPIYSGGKTSAARRKAAQEQLKNKELYLKAKRDATLAARSSHLTVLTTSATVKARAQAITSNRSALEATQAGYDVGTRDLVDVLNSQRLLYIAERNYYDALYDYILATLKLKQAGGILTAEDLFALDKSLDTKRAIAYKR